MKERFPPGWYLNPRGPGQRYWDGEGWTEHYKTIPVSPAPAKPQTWLVAVAMALGVILIVAVLSWIVVA